MPNFAWRSKRSKILLGRVKGIPSLDTLLYVSHVWLTVWLCFAPSNVFTFIVLMTII